jgi:hypothetical protein
MGPFAREGLDLEDEQAGPRFVENGKHVDRAPANLTPTRRNVLLRRAVLGWGQRGYDLCIE